VVSPRAVLARSVDVAGRETIVWTLRGRWAEREEGQNGECLKERQNLRTELSEFYGI